MGESISGKIIRNTAYNVIGYFWSAVVALLLTPYTVSRLGDQAYGLLVIAGILTGYFGLLDFGINTSFIKYISEYNAKGERERVGEVVSTGLAFYALFSAAVLVPGLFFSPWLASLVKVPPGMEADAMFLIRTGFLTFAVVNLSSPFTAVQRGLQRLDVTNKLGMAGALLNAAGVIWAIEGGWGARGVMGVYLALAAARAAADVAAAYRLFPGLAVGPAGTRRELFAEMFSFGLKLQVTRVSGMLSAHLDKLLIAFFLSAGLVTAYQVGNMIVVYAVSAFALLTGALMPAFAELASKGDGDKAADGYEFGSRYLSLLACPAFGFLMLCAPQIIRAWMGPGFDSAALALRILSAGWLVNTVLGSVGGAFVQALGRPQVQMRGALLNIVLNPVLSVLLLLKFGFAGAVAGTSLAIAVSALYFTWELHKDFSLPLRPFLESALLLPAAAAAAASAGARLALLAVGGFNSLAPRAAALAELAVCLAVSSSIYLLLMLLDKPLRPADADRLFGRDGRLRSLASRFCRATEAAV